MNSVEAAAEIVALRNLAHAHRGKKTSLNMRIPSSALNSLQHVTDLLVNDESFLDMIKRREVKNLLTEGHGGAMIDKIRELSGKGMKLSARAGTIVNQNTYGGRIHELQEQAKILKK